MRVLLDTHTFLWIAQAPNNLSEKAIIAIEQAEERWLSIASIWELQIKMALGKLRMKYPLPVLIREECRLNHFQILPVVVDDIYHLNDLPQHHNDPFDRILIAQALHNHLFLVTTDPKIARYDLITTIW